MDTVGSECAALFGYFDSGPMCVEVPGTSTLPWLDWKPLLAEVQEFLTGTGHLSWATVSSRRFSSRTSSARPRSFGRSVTRPGPAYCRHITRP